MKILIIGSNGFIGSNAVTYFQIRGHEIICCDIATDLKESYYTIHNPQADFDRIFKNHKFDVCINASGLANVQLSFAEPLLDFDLNVQNVYTILSCIKKHNEACKFINFSSAAIYGNPRVLPIVEENISCPMSPYGTHKLYSEQICQEFQKYFGLKTCSLRVFSAYGPGLKKQLFWDIYQKQLMSDSIILYGTGKESRDFIFIKDLLYAVECVINNSAFDGKAYNLANGEEDSIEKVANLFLRHFSPNKKAIFSGEFKVGDPMHWRANIDSLKQMGYKKSVTLEEGLSAYANWIKKIN